MSRLTALAWARLSRKLARRLDSEDIVMSAWRSFFAAAGRDQIAVPDDDNLWPLLVTMTLRKLARQAKRHTASKRSVDSEASSGAAESWPEVVSRDPSPEEAAMVTDEIESLMSTLSEADRDILTRRLQGEEHAAIAAAVGCSERTVRRALQRVWDESLSRHETESELTFDSGRPQRDQTRDEFSIPTGHDAHARRVYSGHGIGFSATISTESVQNKQPLVAQPPESRKTVPLSEAGFTYDDIVLEQLIGQGAFGRVYRSRLADGQIVAVKFLRKNLWQDSRAAKQLIREVSLLSSLSHPGIVRHLGWGQTDAGAVFSVMEFVDGQDLTRWRQSGKVSLREVVRCGLELCEAVAAAHQSGVIHADLTPSNVLRRRDGRFVLTDFGFSRVAGDSLQIAGGTPGFLSPEQLCDAFGIVSERTDVYGIGGILYFLLTGKPPVSGETVPDAIAETLSSRPVLPVSATTEGVPVDFSDLLRRCLSKEPQDRPESVGVVLRELSQIAEKS